MNTFTLSFVGLIVAIIISRIISEKALKALSNDEKGILLDSFSKYRLYNTVLILGLVLVYFAATNYFPQSYSTLTLVFVVLFFITSFTITVLSYKKLKSINMPEGYRKSFLVSTITQYLGVGIVFLPMFWKALEPLT